MSNDMIQKATTQATAKTPDAKTSMQVYIKQMQGEIKKALPAVMTPERFTRIVLSALSANPKLAQTTPQSFLAAMMTAAQLGMEPNTPLGQAYLIPYYNSKSRCNECQFQLGYKGLIDLAYPASSWNEATRSFVLTHSALTSSCVDIATSLNSPGVPRTTCQYYHRSRRCFAQRIGTLAFR